MFHLSRWQSLKMFMLLMQMLVNADVVNAGYLRGEGINVQRKRVRHTLTSVDPVGTAHRWGQTVSRRVYKVSMPNSLWHMDSHMKLIR